MRRTAACGCVSRTGWSNPSQCHRADPPGPGCMCSRPAWRACFRSHSNRTALPPPGRDSSHHPIFKPGGATLSNSISLIHPGPGQVLSGSHSSGLVDHVQHATRPTHRALPPRPLPTPASVIQRSRHYARTWCTRPQHDGPGAACAHARALRTARLVPFLSQWWRSGRTASPHRAWFGRAGWCAGPGAPEQLGWCPTLSSKPNSFALTPPGPRIAIPTWLPSSRSSSFVLTPPD